MMERARLSGGRSVQRPGEGAVLLARVRGRAEQGFAKPAAQVGTVARRQTGRRRIGAHLDSGEHRTLAVQNDIDEIIELRRRSDGAYVLDARSPRDRGDIHTPSRVRQVGS